MSKKIEEPKKEEIILYRSMDEVMHDSMIPYAEHVILERALPRVEDGLKPVQRRILYTMLELGLSPDKPHRKSARIVGDCLGKYHPHGDSSVYEAMVHMAQPFAMSLPLVDGHGNFGSIDGDTAAAMRYTEARMTDAAMQLLRDIDLDTVDYSLNFDDTLKEPDLLPGRFPNLLINGAAGIAVGLATNIPPHNPGEAIDAAVAMIDDPKISLKKLMEIMPAPDFPTGGYLIDSPEIAAAYETGRGKLTMRAKTHFEQLKNGKTLIVVTEIPYGINKAAALQKILAVTQEKKAVFAGVADIRDESDRQGMRAVIEVKKDADPEKILQALFKYSDLQCTFGVNMTAIAEGKPQQLDLRSILKYFIGHQKNVITRRTKCELETARRREHILEGLMVAVDHVDAVIKLIRGSKSPKEAKEKLMAKYGLSEVQAQAILDLRLQRLTNLELVAIEREYHDVQKRIAELEGILASERKLMALIKKELLEIKKLFPVPRRTQIVKGEARIELADENAVVTEEMAVAFCADLKVRKWPARLFTLGEISADKPWQVVKIMGDKKLRLFTDRGDMLMLNVSDIPETRPTARAVSLTSLLAFEKNEQIVAVFPEDGDRRGESERAFPAAGDGEGHVDPVRRGGGAQHGPGVLGREGHQAGGRGSGDLRGTNRRRGRAGPHHGPGVLQAVLPLRIRAPGPGRQGPQDLRLQQAGIERHPAGLGPAREGALRHRGGPAPEPGDAHEHGAAAAGGSVLQGDHGRDGAPRRRRGGRAAGAAWKNLTGLQPWGPVRGIEGETTREE